MTDEERKKLVAELREDAPDWTTSGQRVRMLCDEIERLSKELERMRINYKEENSSAQRQWTK